MAEIASVVAHRISTKRDCSFDPQNHIMHSWEVLWSEVQMPMTLCKEIEQRMKSIWSHKRPRIAKAILRKKNEMQDFTFPDNQAMLQHYSN